MMQKPIFILALWMLASDWAVHAQEDASRELPIRKDHPRILFNKDQLSAIRAKCEGPFAKEYAQLKTQADDRIDEILADGFVGKSLAERGRLDAGEAWEGLEAIGLLWHLTGDERYAQAGRRLHELLIKVSEETIAAVAALDRSQTLRGKQLLDTLHGHSDDVLFLAFSPSGNLLASGAKDHSARIWDLEIAELLQQGCRLLRNASPSFGEDGQTVCADVPDREK